MSILREAYHSYTPLQRRNIAVYMGGIFFYKLALEFFNGSITTLATDRFNSSQTYQKLGAAQGLNQAMQCVGAILIAPLAARFPTRSVLSFAVFVFALMTSILLIVDAATGGHIRKPGGPVEYGTWNPNAIFPIWGIAGIAYGMVELIRRVIPADICGGDVMRLRRMDATVHVFYEVAGTIGAFTSSSAISRLGNNYSYIVSPIMFVIAGAIWLFIKPTPKQSHDDAALAVLEEQPHRGKNYFTQIAWGTYLFFKSMWVGGVLIFTHRKFVWLFTSYSLALYLHRFLESSLSPAFAKRVLGNSAWSQIMVGGSNFGELLGALSVFLLANRVPTPIPWLRIDALMLNLVWTLPRYSQIATHSVKWAWYVALTFLPVSFGWAAGDVSLAAYIQSALNDMTITTPGISPLGAVMSFLYSTYIVLNAVLSSVLGGVIDDDFTANDNIYRSLQRVGGIQFTVCSAVIIASTFVPRGSWAINPKPIGDLQTVEDTARDSADEGEHIRPRDGEKGLGRTGSHEVDSPTQRGSESFNGEIPSENKNKSAQHV